MTVAAILTAQARRELARALKRIAADNPDAADGLNDAVLDASRLIGGNPALGARRPSLAGPRYRFWPIPRYRYLMVYTDATDPPRILRLLHTSRDLSQLLADLRKPPAPRPRVGRRHQRPRRQASLPLESTGVFPPLLRSPGIPIVISRHPKARVRVPRGVELWQLASESGEGSKRGFSRLTGA